MSYEDRLRTAVYVAPSGGEHALEFFELERSIDKKAAVNEAPEREGADVQDLNQASLRVPITGYISGPDYDQAADALWTALQETGPGELRHPRWGNIDVLPVSVSQFEAFTGQSRRARFEIDFIRTLGANFPESNEQIGANVESQANDLQSSLGGSLTEGYNTGDPGALSEAKSSVLGGLENFNDSVSSIAAGVDETATQIDAAGRKLENNIDDLVKSPFELAQSVASLYRTPGRVATDIVSKMRGYKDLVDGLVENVASAPLTQAVVSLFQAKAATTAMAEATLTGSVDRRDQAVLAAETLADTYNGVVNAQEPLEGDDYSESHTVMAGLQGIVTDAYRYLIERSFSLRAERRIVLIEDRTPLDIVAAVYPDGELDDRLDEFIDENQLTGTDILFLPAGREVRYYA